MTADQDQAYRGRFRLKNGTQLLRSADGGAVLQSDPLRAYKLNRSAFGILERCGSGVHWGHEQDLNAAPGVVAFMDTLLLAGIVEWLPDAPRNPPLVSIVIPVFNRAAQIEACLRSLQALDYPSDKIEIIVVDDASWDHSAAVARRFGVRLIVQPCNRGQSAARNSGAAMARGDIIAFLDSDCVARPEWLRELVPYFQDRRVAVVGGFVDTYYHEKRIDRYEQVCSALNMGPDAAIGRGSNAVFYVPTCNMLISRKVYQQAAGFDESLRVGEDVDLCWRLMAAGHRLLYIPKGRVLHKHRSRLWPALLRRFDYGTSEAMLYSRFPGVVKKFPVRPAAIVLSLILAAALATRSWHWLLLVPGLLAFETLVRRRQMRRKMNIRLPLRATIQGILMAHARFLNYPTFYLVRYHLLLLIGLSFMLPSLIGLWSALIVYPVASVYLRKRPRLSFPVFAFFYLAEHAFYQSGVFWGCLRQKSFRLYRIQTVPKETT
jgi:mycofactocin glycosyltransferase